MRNLIYSLIFCLAFMAEGQILAKNSGTCKDLAIDLQIIHPDLPRIFKAILDLHPALVQARVTPTWEDFDNLAKIMEDLSRVRQEIAAAGKIDSLETAMREFQKIAKEKDIFNDLAASAEPMGGDYKPTEYDLKILYQRMLLDLNRELPSELRFAIRKLIPDDRPEKLKIQGRELLQRIENRFNEMFSTTGYASLEDFTRAMQTDPVRARLLDIMENEKIQVTIRRPEGARWWVPKVGFQNQFVTRSSEGYYKPETRNHVEAGWTDQPYETYKDFDNELKPKYGSFRVDLDQDIVSSDPDNLYGPDVYILRKDLIRDRTTFNIGDSNGRVGYFVKGIHNEWENGFKASSWDQLFIPWADRSLLVPFMEKNFRKNNSGNSPSIPNPEIIKMSQKEEYLAYFETQIFGPLTLDEVETFEFSKSPPNGEFLAELQKRNIKIFDGRDWPPKPWQP